MKGTNGKLQGFGYCDYAEADSALRAIRLLTDFEIGGKKLVIKADAKTTERLDSYSKEKEKTCGNLQELNEETKNDDLKAKSLIDQLLKDNEADINARIGDDNKGNADNQQQQPNQNANNFTQQLNKNQIPPEPNLQNFSDMDIEDEKKTLIHREIGKFRSTYKKQDEEKEKLESERAKERESRRDRERDKERSRDRDRERDKERDRRLSPVRDRNNDRNDRKLNESNRYDRERESSRYDRSDRESSSRSGYDQLNDEAIERRRQEREERKKEQAYQKRLKDWESREDRKKRQYEKDKYKLIEKKKEEEIKLARLKQHLEDYNDDIDDAKYYKGSNLIKKLRDYDKEREEDERDRELEKKELDDLRKKLAEEGHPDPENEAMKLMSSKITVKAEHSNNDLYLNNNNHQQQHQEEIHVKAFTLTKQDHNRQLKTSLQQTNNNGNNINNDAQHITPISDFNNQPSNNVVVDKKKKLSVQDVFNSNDDDEKVQQVKKRKLPVLIDDNTDSNQSITSNLNKNPDQSNLDSKSSSNDDKRKQIKALIDNIPTTKEDLFKYEIEWDYVDASLMEKRIRPWINKKITEYIGEEEKALLDFICDKLNAKCNAQSILDDVAMVLDDEAEVFIVKMLRLLIYEIEAKKMKIC